MVKITGLAMLTSYSLNGSYIPWW